MSDEFMIPVAGEVDMEICPVRIKDVIVDYDIYIVDRYLCTIYPDIKDAFLEWKSNDKIDPYLVQLIGKAIEGS